VVPTNLTLAEIPAKKRNSTSSEVPKQDNSSRGSHRIVMDHPQFQYRGDVDSADPLRRRMITAQAFVTQKALCPTNYD